MNGDGLMKSIWFRLAALGVILSTIPLNAPTARVAISMHGSSDMPPSETSRQAASAPIWEYLEHDIGEIRLRAHNWASLSRLESPRGSDLEYFNAARLLFACVRGVDTLVTNSINSYREIQSYQHLSSCSNRRSRPDFHLEARAEQQYGAVCSDTAISSDLLDQIELRLHKPLGLEIHQTTYAWSEEFSRRLVIADWWIVNISGQPLHNAYVGLDVTPNARYSPGEESPVDNYGDICGFLGVAPGIADGTLDTVNIVWSADNDGDPVSQDGRFVFAASSPTGVAGVRILRVPAGGHLSFNWWTPSSWWENWRSPENWGPRRHENRAGYAGSLGPPIGDRGHFNMMRNGEIDYDQVFTAVDLSWQGWSPPPAASGLAEEIAGGYNIRYILSYGPLPAIAPGDSVPFTVAFVAGTSLHRQADNFSANFVFQNPKPYLDRLDFTDLVSNARWADWLFDNPGVDTDGDGDRGAAYLVDCDQTGCDSVFYKGDGIPDWQGPSAPPAPDYEMRTEPARLILQWNGAFSESFTDPFSLRRDFEGFRLYVGKSDRNDQFSLVGNWDREDFKRLAYDPVAHEWTQISDPATIDEWSMILGDDLFDPRDYPVPSLHDAYRDSFPDTTRNAQGDIVLIRWRERHSYWEAEASNRCNEYWDTDHWETNLIQKVDERDTVIDGALLTFGIYEATLEGLNPSIPLYCAITAFDFGDYQHGVQPLESSPAANSRYFEPINSSDVVLDSGLAVRVFPNPYKTQYTNAGGKRTTYYLEGYEGRGIVEFVEQDRRIHFINLPDTATINIYSLDGDLIRTIHHPDPFLTTYSSSVGWDLISRNAQAVVSGIYIWRVDSKLGTQVGKLVIIK